MTSKIIFYEDFKDHSERINFCNQRDISYLPSKKNNNVFFSYKKEQDIFEKDLIKNTDKLEINDFPLEKSILNSFSLNKEIKFIFKNQILVGIVHFSDYNGENIYIHLYSELLYFERTLKDLLNSNYKQKEVENFLMTYVCEKRLTNYKKDTKGFFPFEKLSLSDLIKFYNKKREVKLSEKICKLRNKVMHFNQFSNHKGDPDVSPLIYDINSFKDFTFRVSELKKNISINKNE